MIEIKNISSDADKIIMNMNDGKNILCVGIAHIENDKAVIMDIIEQVPGVAFMMGKALLNSIDLKGIMHVECYNVALKDVLYELRFKYENDLFCLNLQDYFTQGCHSK